MLTENSMNEISVIVTAYNIEKYIGRCLDELLEQSYQDFNVLIVDDSSTDKTAAIAEDYAQKYPGKICFLSTPVNLGAPSLTRNFALDSWFGGSKYLIFLDGDDRIEPNFLENLHSCAEETKADITVCAYDRVEEGTGHILCREMRFPNTMILNPSGDERLAFFNTAPWNKLIRSSIITSLRFPDIRFVDDVGFFLELCKKANTVATLNEILIHYQVRPNSGITKLDEKNIWDFADNMRQRLIDAKNDSRYYELLALSTFIHIGISMPMRAFDNPAINKGVFLKKIRNYLYVNNLMGRREFLSFSRLLKHGIRGIAIWGCRFLYRVRGMGIFLRLYGFCKRILKIDVKF